MGLPLRRGERREGARESSAARGRSERSRFGGVRQGIGLDRRLEVLEARERWLGQGVQELRCTTGKWRGSNSPALTGQRKQHLQADGILVEGHGRHATELELLLVEGCGAHPSAKDKRQLHARANLTVCAADNDLRVEIRVGSRVAALTHVAERRSDR